ncbi:MAG: histidine phosphatase family protein [Candidatus Woesebacteria bacterium]
MKENKNRCTFYIVRHGQTEWNVDHRLQGHMDSPLTPDGILQAEELAKTFTGTHFDAAYSSDSFRAHRTAQIVSSEHNLVVKTNQLLREGYYGEYEGKKVTEYREELKDLLEAREQLADQERFTFELGHGIETNEKMVSRFITFLREAALAHPTENVLVVSHGGMIAVLLVHLGFGTFRELAPGSVKNLAYLVLESDGTDFYIKKTHNIEKMQ